MANGTFFVSWVLWQQMTFILAMGITAVFCAGLIKLWWNNRLMRKQEILDEEKRSRYTEMRKSGISVGKRGNDIPFGVRAIQSGIEVDGIWISRPPTPDEIAAAKLASSTTLESMNPDAQRRGKQPAEDQRPGQAATTTNPEKSTAPKHSPSDGSIFQRLTDAESMESTQAGTPGVSQFASHQHKRQYLRGQTVLNEDTLRRLEGQAQHSRPVYDTYIPTSAPRNPRRPSQRSSASSSGESMDSQPTRSARSASGRSYTSSRSSRLYMARSNIHENSRPTGAPGGGGYSSGSQTWGPAPDRDQHQLRDPYDSSLTRTPSGMTAFSQSDRHGSIIAGQELPVPEPTFGPGDLHVNRSTRRVNNGFEVLPAGTFGVPPHDFAVLGMGGNAGVAGGTDLESVEEAGGYNGAGGGAGGSWVPRGANRLKKRAGGGHGQ